MGTIAETWINQGMAEGVAKGMADGVAKGMAEGVAKGVAEGKAKAKGKASTLVRLLGRRFGPLPASTRIRIDGATEKELDDWIDAVLEAPTLAAVFLNGSSP